MSDRGAVVGQAAHWAAMLDAGDMDDADRAAFALWRDADPVHRETLRRMRAFDARIEEAEPFEHRALAQLVTRRSRRRAPAGAAVICIALFAGIAWSVVGGDPSGDGSPDYRTARGEIRSMTLADGSDVTINTNAAISLTLDRGQRKVRLIRGEILATVAKDRRRPFVVQTTHGSATALGTAFLVSRDKDLTRVTVIRSLVRVCAARPTDDCQLLRPGQQAIIDGRRVSRIADRNPALAASWATGWLEVDDRPTDEVLHDLNRYRLKPVRFDADVLHGVRVTGNFPLRDPDQALEGVLRSAGLVMRRAGDDSILIVRR